MPWRLHVPALPAAPAPRLVLPPAQRHKLAAVLRARAGDELLCFSEAAGEWRCRLLGSPARGEVEVVARLRAPLAPLRAGAPWRGPLLAFTPLRPERTRFLLEKAVELGAGALLPLRTDRAAHALAADKALEWASGAAEQCGRLDAPALLLAGAPPTALALLGAWPAGGAALPQLPLPCARVLLVGDAAAGVPARELPWGRGALSRGAGAAQVGVLVGPEGGFSEREYAALAAAAAAAPAGSGGGATVLRVQLAPNTLRSETAALALLALLAAHLD